METEVVSHGDPARVLLVDALALRRAAVVAFLGPWAEGLGADLLSAEPPIDKPAVEFTRIIVVNLGGAALHENDAQSVVRGLRSLAPSTPIAVLSDREHADDVVSAFQSGVSGYIPNSTEPQVALRALTFIMNGGNFFPPTALLNSPKRPQPRSERTGASHKRTNGGGNDAVGNELTTRQQEVLDLVCLGKRNKEIARALSMQEATVKVHVRQIMRKLGVANRTEAALMRASEMPPGVLSV